MPSQRQEVLSLYKQLLRLSRTWQSAKNSSADTEAERAFIRDESRRLFRLNKHLTSSKDIDDRLFEGRSRLEIALHYKVPYPRPVYAPPDTFASIDKRTRKKFLEKVARDATPAYIKSDEERIETKAGKAIDMASRQFLSTQPVASLDFKYVFLNESSQRLLLSQTVLNPLVEKYPLNRSYTEKFLKRLISWAEENNVEVCDDLYELYCSKMAACSDRLLEADQTYCHRILALNVPKQATVVDKKYADSLSDFIVLRESEFQITDATTGLSLWEGAYYLAQWIFDNQELFCNRNLFELGSGLGLAGIAALKACPQIGSFIFSDSHGRVLDYLRWNVAENSQGDSGRGKVTDLNWHDFTMIESIMREETALAHTPIDYVLASDVVYDEDLMPGLVNALRCLMKLSSTHKAFIVQTLRNVETLDSFTAHLRAAGIDVNSTVLRRPIESEALVPFPAATRAELNCPMLLLELCLCERLTSC